MFEQQRIATRKRKRKSSKKQIQHTNIAFLKARILP
jgi:hypothetical protein